MSELLAEIVITLGLSALVYFVIYSFFLSVVRHGISEMVDDIKRVYELEKERNRLLRDLLKEMQKHDEDNNQRTATNSTSSPYFVL